MEKRKFKNKMTYKGRFVPERPQKYKGNSRNIVYRSMWERKVMSSLDRNDNVLEWASEEIVIPYESPLDGKLHRYYPDFWIKVQQGPKTKEFIIELKPSKQLKAPKANPKRKTKGYLYEVREWGRNNAKWKAAKAYCDKKEMDFLIWTEKDLGL